MNNVFRVLMYDGKFVNVSNSGAIYEVSTPKLYSGDDTIESLIKWSKLSTDFNGNPFVSEEYLDALQKCELVEYKLVKNHV